MDPGWSGLSLHLHVPVGVLWPPLSLFRQSRQPAAKTSLPAGSESQNTHRRTNMYTETYAFILILAMKISLDGSHPFTKLKFCTFVLFCKTFWKWEKCPFINGGRIHGWEDLMQRENGCCRIILQLTILWCSSCLLDLNLLLAAGELQNPYIACFFVTGTPRTMTSLHTFS